MGNKQIYVNNDWSGDGVHGKEKDCSRPVLEPGITNEKAGPQSGNRESRLVQGAMQSGLPM